MSADTKYQVMAELTGVSAAALEKAEEQASRIIDIVKGECACSIPCSKETLHKVQEWLPDGDYTASPPDFTPSDLSALHDSGMSWDQVGMAAGITGQAARKRAAKWKKQITSTEIYEPGAEEARQEAERAEATIRGAAKSGGMEENSTSSAEDEIPAESKPEVDARIVALQTEGIGAKKIQKLIKWEYGKDLSLNDIRAASFVQKRIAAGDMDIEIMQAVKRNFPGVKMNVADIQAWRQKA